MEGGDTLTIKQAATLLNCHPNTVRNRIKKGTLQADTVITERWKTYMILRLACASLGPSKRANIRGPGPAEGGLRRAILSL
jgi:hypothetical protein